MNWTDEQKEVITSRGCHLLVSAAAGSGKTAVLVERILSLVTDEKDPVDIDSLLVVTFTRAAAAQMRERLAASLEQKAKEDPQNERLRRQQVLLHNAKITTIDSFCSFVVRSHFGDIGLDPNFRVADPAEISMLTADVIDAVFEEAYQQADPSFLLLTETYRDRRGDAPLREMITQILQKSQSSAWPKEWISGLSRWYTLPDKEALLASEPCRMMIEDACRLLRESWERLRTLSDTAEAFGLTNYAKTLKSDQKLFSSLFREPDERLGYERLQAFFASAKFGSMKPERLAPDDPQSKAEAKERIKNERNEIKDAVGKCQKENFSLSPDELFAQVSAIRPIAEALVSLSLRTQEALEEEKRKRRIVDFSDMEHFTLRIFIDEQTREIRPAAEEMRRQFAAVMVDEYQDSNEVQELILSAVSRQEEGERNYFCVGDVKQSIYRFRLARPEIFTEKYKKYQAGEGTPGRLIVLSKNFRSRPPILAFVNHIFRQIMREDLGGVTYDKEAMLSPGAVFLDAPDMQPEVLLFDENADEAEEEMADAAPGFAGEDESAQGEEKPPIESEGVDQKEESAFRMEIKMIAQRILSLLKSGTVTDEESGASRPVRCGDIAILLRSTKSRAADFLEILPIYGIPVRIRSETGYFSAPEVLAVLSYLQILDNPLQDVPLAAVLRSPFADLSDEQLSQIRLRDQNRPFCEVAWEALREAEEGSACRNFYDFYQKMRALVPDTSVFDLIGRLLRESGYAAVVSSLPAGRQRMANLSMLQQKAADYEKSSYRGLFSFVRYIKQLREADMDFGEAEPNGEAPDAVLIETIHKSKGLEYPIVILAGIDRPFNRADERGKMLLHEDLGMGLDEILRKPRRRRKCFLRSQTAGLLQKDALGEEIRVLYVALTRAREKLILTGRVKDYRKKKEQLCRFGRDGGALSYSQRAGAKSYLDWILPALVHDEGLFDEKREEDASFAAGLIEVFSRKEILLPAKSKEKSRAAVGEKAPAGSEKEGERGGAGEGGAPPSPSLAERIDAVPKETIQELQKQMHTPYPYEEEQNRKSKYAVSELKRAQATEALFSQDAQPAYFLSNDPASAGGIAPSGSLAQKGLAPFGERPLAAGPAPQRDEQTASARGSAMHRFLQHLSLKDLYRNGTACVSEEEAAAFVRRETDRLIRNNRLSKKEASLLSLSQITHFLTQPIARSMAEAQERGDLFTEQPFVSETGGVLIQGIIDAYWPKGDRIVLLDYKTDRVREEEELLCRYRVQIALYADALGRLYADEAGKLALVESFIYSFALGCSIKVDLSEPPDISSLWQKSPLDSLG